MSYTTQIKEEISRNVGSKSEMIAELSGYIRNNGHPSVNGFQLTTENPLICERIEKQIETLYEIKLKKEIKDSLNFSKKDLFVLTIKEKKDFINLLRTLQLETKISIIMTTSDLNVALESDYLLIISEKQILLEGEPLTIIEKDNVLNKIGLELPFMVDLSVKLRDYNLVEKVELDMDRMVDTIWK